MMDDGPRRGRYRLDPVPGEQRVGAPVEVREAGHDAPLEDPVHHVQRLAVDTEPGHAGSERLGEDRGTDRTGRDVGRQGRQGRDPPLQLFEGCRQPLLCPGRDLGSREHVFEVGLIDQRELAGAEGRPLPAARSGGLYQGIQLAQHPAGEGGLHQVLRLLQQRPGVEVPALADVAGTGVGGHDQVLVDVAKERDQQSRKPLRHRPAQVAQRPLAEVRGKARDRGSGRRPGAGIAAAAGAPLQGIEGTRVRVDKGDAQALLDHPRHLGAQLVGARRAVFDEREVDRDPAVPRQGPARRRQQRHLLRGQGQEHAPETEIAHGGRAGGIAGDPNQGVQVDRVAGVGTLVQRIGRSLGQAGPAGL